MHLILLVLIILVQTILNIFLIVSVTIYKDNFDVFGIPIHLVFMFFLSIGSLFLLVFLLQKEEKRMITFTEETHKEQFEALVTSVRSDRHDLNNHLTVIAGLIKLENYSAASDYICGVVGDVKINNQVLSIKNPILSAMLFVMMSKFQKEQVPFALTISDESITDVLSTTDLIRLLTNLLDNAYEATRKLAKGEQQISLDMSITNNAHLLEVTNSCKHRFHSKFLEAGYSTKLNKNSGFGLEIVQEITKKYDGNLSISVKNSLITFKISLPIKKVAEKDI